MIDMKAAYTAYKIQFNGCRGRVDRNGDPIEMRMTFGEWLMVWIESGKWHLRGTKLGCYCMARRNDIGHYEVGNVRIISHVENTKERIPYYGAKHTEEFKTQMSDNQSGAKNNFYGKKHKPESIAKWRASMAKRKAQA